MIKIINNLNVFFEKTKFKFILCGSYQRPISSLSRNEERYVQIVNKNDIECCYMDWLEYEFSESELEKYGREIPNDQGNGDDDISKEYMELSQLIIKYFNNDDE